MSKIVQKIAVIASLVAVMGGTLTFIMTWRNVGFGEDFLFSWLSSFALCVLCIAPIGGVISVMVHRFVNAMFSALSKLQMNIVFGLIMAVIMESIMSIVTTVNLHGFIAVEHFIVFWASTLATALPAGVLFSVLMSLLIKPRLEVFLAR